MPRRTSLDGVMTLLDLFIQTFDDRAERLRGRLIGIYGLLIVVNAIDNGARNLRWR